jgi:hypothetical protein
VAQIGRIDLQGSINELRVPTASSFPFDIAIGPRDKGLWFTEFVGNKIGQIRLTR